MTWRSFSSITDTVILSARFSDDPVQQHVFMQFDSESKPSQEDKDAVTPQYLWPFQSYSV